MSNFIYPVLQGLTFNSVRSPHFNTAKQQALTGKESRIAYQQWPLWHWELIYEYLSPADLLALHGLFIAVQGDFDTFLYTDPLFNAVAAQQSPSSRPEIRRRPSTRSSPSTKTPAVPGGPELIQNFEGTPTIYGNGTLIPSGHYSISGTGGVTFSAMPAAATVLTWTGSFYYRVRFDNDDALDVSQFLKICSRRSASNSCK